MCSSDCSQTPCTYTAINVILQPQEQGVLQQMVFDPSHYGVSLETHEDTEDTKTKSVVEIMASMLQNIVQAGCASLPYIYYLNLWHNVQNKKVQIKVKTLNTFFTVSSSLSAPHLLHPLILHANNSCLCLEIN